ncbi:MAG: hypothetical protein ACNA7O_12810 [Rhodobacterales bacterium]
MIRFHFSAAALALLVAIAPLQAKAQDAPAPETRQDEQRDSEDGLSLMERGARMFLEGMRGEMAPALEDLRDMLLTMGPVMQQFLREMGPAMTELLGRIDDLTVYQMPELLPNGDIIIRRKPDAGPLPPPADEEIDI